MLLVEKIREYNIKKEKESSNGGMRLVFAFGKVELVMYLHKKINVLCLHANYPKQEFGMGTYLLR